MTHPGTDRHQGGVSIRETECGRSPGLMLKDIVGADTSPVLAGKIAVAQRVFNAVLRLLDRFFRLHKT